MVGGLDDESRKSLVEYRLQRAKESLADADVLTSCGSYIAAVNRLYYACYYACVALLVNSHIPAHTHDGVKHQLGLHFIHTGKLPRETGRFYSKLFGARQTGDYEDFVQYGLKDIEEIRPHAAAFIESIEQLLKKQ